MILSAQAMSRNLPRRAAPLLLLSLLLPACQPLPHPFADDRPPPASPILSPPEAVGIVVQPVAGVPAPMARVLAGAMVAALQKEDVPADTVAGNERSYRLTGIATPRPAGGTVRVAVTWQLSGADGHAVATETAAAEIAAAAWAAGSADAVKPLVAPAAMLARRVEGDTPKEHAVTAATLGIVPVAVTGAASDGGHALSMAIAAALHHAGVPLQEKPGDRPSFLLAGTVDVGAAKSGRQDVKITWALSRADGKSIGQVSQENAVPAGSLDGRWGDTAYDVAAAAVAGIVELLQRAQTVGS
jgi:hypothetical protein